MAESVTGATPPTPAAASVPRRARVERRTGEVTVTVELDLDGQGRSECDTGVPFLDHMLAQLAKHGRLDLTVLAKGDLEVDSHHTVEDTGIALGQALGEALGDKSGLRRFGDATVPLDEARARVALDLSGRPYLVWDVRIEPGYGELGAFHPLHARHLLESVVASARFTLHVVLEAGDLPHHCLESIFKGIARALGDACTPDLRAGSGSTKGTLA
jgi:imidazoleglycerol-phosphate dehydratase